MPAYATRAQLEANEGWETTNATATDALLMRATLDIDAIFGPLAVIRTGTYAGQKLDPTLLDTVDRAALAAATTRQATHRADLERVGGREPGVRRVKGPDYEVEYGDRAQASSGRYSPDLPELLSPLSHLRRLQGARLR